MSTVDLRCEGRLHGRLTDGRWLEVKCTRRACGHEKGSVTLHTIDITTGKVTDTRSFAEPSNQERKGRHNASVPRPSVRSS